MIREATVEDLPEICRRGVDWHGASHWPEFSPFNADDFAASLTDIIASDKAVLLVSGDNKITGAICVLYVPLYFNFAARLAQEFFWFSDDPKTGLGLLRAAEARAFGDGCTCFLLGAQNIESRTEKIYGRLGYVPFNGNFVKGR